jgi:hypothetical protein
MRNSTFKNPGKPLARKTPLKSRKPMSRGTARLECKTPLKPSGKPLRARKPKADKPKRVARNAGPIDYLALCRGPVGCFLLVPGHHHHGHELTEPSHSNQARHGKGMAMKALDIYTVPACRACHREIDQGSRYTRDEKFALWDDAYARWEPVRAAKIAASQASKGRQIQPESPLQIDIISN